MSDKIDSCVTCPVCERLLRKPSSAIFCSAESTTWSDECACSDFSTCAYHQIHWAEAPSRPSQEVLEERAKKKYEDAKAEWERLRNKVAAAIENGAGK